MFKAVNVTNQENTYENTTGDHGNGKAIDHPPTSTPPYLNPLRIEKPISDVVLRPLKSAI
jgi:hypothetical protein